MQSALRVIRPRCCLRLSFLAAAANQWSPREAPTLRHVTTSQDHSPTTSFSPTLARGPRHPGRRNDEAPQTLVATRPPEATTRDRTNRVPLSGAGQSWRLAPPLPGHFSVVAESFWLASSLSGCRAASCELGSSWSEEARSSPSSSSLGSLGSLLLAASGQPVSASSPACSLPTILAKLYSL